MLTFFKIKWIGICSLNILDLQVLIKDTLGFDFKHRSLTKRRRGLNPGRLVKKHERFLCALTSPLKMLLYGRRLCHYSLIWLSKLCNTEVFSWRITMTNKSLVTIVHLASFVLGNTSELTFLVILGMNRCESTDEN